MKKLVQNNNIGVVARENSPEGLVEAITKFQVLDNKNLMKNIYRINTTWI